MRVRRRSSSTLQTNKGNECKNAIGALLLAREIFFGEGPEGGG